MIHACARLQEPDDVVITIALTMTAGEWRRLTKVVNGGDYPAWPVADAIRKAVEAFTDAHEATVEYERA